MDKYYSKIMVGLIAICIFLAGYCFYLEHRYKIYKEDVGFSFLNLHDEIYQLKVTIERKNEAISLLDQNSDLKEMILMLQPRLDNEMVDIYIKYIDEASREFGFPPKFIAAIIMRESGFDPMARSSANARGPMQVIGKYHEEKLQSRNIRELELHQIKHGIFIGTWVIRQYYDESNGDIRKALLKYVGAVTKDKNDYVNDILEYFAIGTLSRSTKLNNNGTYIEEINEEEINEEEINED